MAKKRYSELSTAARSRLLVVSLLRSLVSIVILLVAYYQAPFDRPIDGTSWLRFGLGLLALAGVVGWQVWAITRSEFPRLRAIQAISTGLTLLIVLFASSYCVLDHNQPESFSQETPLSRTDALYFTVTVFATVGFGDISPQTELARVVTMIQMLCGLLVLGLIAKILLGAVDVAVRRRQAGEPESPGPARQA